MANSTVGHVTHCDAKASRSFYAAEIIKLCPHFLSLASITRLIQHWKDTGHQLKNAEMDGISSSSTATNVPKPCIGILSIGEMGLGAAKVLRAHDFPVVTVATGRRHVLVVPFCPILT